jgi:dihydrolipoamide dehydrogenase
LPQPNLADLGLENTKVTKDDKGLIHCNAQQQTDDPDIYAIGDVNGGALLRTARPERAQIAAEALLGNRSFENIVVPAVYTDQGGVVRSHRSEAKQKHRHRLFCGGVGRALTLDRPDGLTKLIIEPERTDSRRRRRRRGCRRTYQ